MSLAEKQARAEQLRGELSALRVEHSAILQDGSGTVQENALDAEIARLEAERDLAAANVEAAKSGGSVDDALAAMRAAAESDKPDTSTADLSTPPDTPEPLPVVAGDGVPVVDEGVVTLMPLPVAEPVVTDEPKTSGE